MPKEILPEGVKLRAFGDHDQLRDDIFDRVLEGYKTKFPLENDKVKLELLDARYDERKKRYGIHDAKRALLEDGSLRTPLLGRVRLTDKLSGQALDEKELTLAHVPTLSHRGTFIVDGTEYGVQNQHRLKSGVYSRIKDNGEIESHLNTKSGTGPQMRVFMEPDTGVYRLKLAQSHAKLYPILKAAGVGDDEMENAWGPDILAANRDSSKKDGERTLSKFYNNLLRYKADPAATPQQQGDAIRDKLNAMELDPEVNQRTLGKPHDRLSPAAIVDASAKLLKLQRGEIEPDDRDALANKTFHSVDDFLGERIKKDAGGLARTLLFRSTYDRSLKSLKPGYFSPHQRELIVSNSLSNAMPGINAFEFRDQAARVTALGEGGIGDSSAVNKSSRNVHPSMLGFIDPIRSSESTAIGVDARFAHRVKKGNDGQIYSPFRNRRSGDTEWLNPTQLAGKTVAFATSPSLAAHVSAPVISAVPAVEPVG